MSETLHTIWPMLRLVRCSTQSSQSRAHRSGMAVSFQLPSGGHQASPQTRMHLTGDKGFVFAQNSRKTGRCEGARVCISSSFCSALLSLLLGGLAVRAPFCCACLTDVDEDGETCRLIRCPYLRLTLFSWRLPCVTKRQFGGAKPQQSPESSIWAHVETRSGGGSKASLPTLLRLNLPSKFAVGRSVAVAPNDVCVTPLRDFPELAQELLCDSSLRRCVAQVSGGRCVSALSILPRPSEHRPDHQILQAKEELF